MFNQRHYLIGIFLAFIFITALTSPVFSAEDSDIFGEKPYIPDIDTFMQIGGASEPAISPDGKTIFLKLSFTGVSQIYRMTESDRYPYQLTFFKEGAGDFNLSPDGSMIIVQADVGGNEQYQLFLMEAKTGKIKQLTDLPKVVFGFPLWSPSCDKIYFRANIDNKRNFDVYEMEVKSAAMKKLYAGKGYFGPATVSHDGKSLLIYEYSGNDNNNLYLMDLATNKTKLLTPHKGSLLYHGIAISADNKKVYCISNNNKSGLLKLASIDVETGKLNFFYDADSPWGIVEASVNPDITVMAVVKNEEGYGPLKLIDLKTGKELPSPVFQGISGTPSLSDTTKMTFAMNTPLTTGEIYTWDWSSKKLTKLTNSSYAGIDPGLFIEPKLIKYKSFDGLEIPAFLYLPPNWEKNKGNIPFIIHFHGGPESQFRPYFQRHFNYLLLNGYGILAPNIRGSSGYGKEYMDMDNYKKRMDSVKDGYYAAKYLIDQGYTKKGKIGIKGGSYGGFMVMALVTEYPDMWGAAQEGVGIVDFENFLKNTSSYRRKLRESEYGPLSDPDFLKSISPIHKIDRIKTPLMVIHGKNDPRVPVSEAYLIIENLKKRGIDVEALIFEDEGHSTRKRGNLLLRYSKMVEFFDKHLKNGKTAEK